MQTEEEPGAARRAVSLTLAGLWAERVAVAFWPAGSWALAGVSALALGAMEGLTGREALAAAGIWLGVLAGLAGWGAWQFRRPRRTEARARVDARLPGAPLSVLGDRVALGANDAGARALWDAHQRVARQLAAQAQPVAPDPALSRRDPFALRLVALTAGAMALVFGGLAPMGAGLGALALNFRAPPGAAAPETAARGPGWEGWAEPPAYTRRPTIYLNALADGAALTVPKGTLFSLRLYGEGVAVAQDLGPAQPGTPPEAPGFTAEKDGTLRIAGRTLAVTVAPDEPPAAMLSKAAERRADGRFVQGWTARDDHGVARGGVEITLDLPAVERRFGLTPPPDPRPPIRLDLTLPAGAARAELNGRISADLARHPWANLPVIVRLSATDGLGQTGAAPPLRMALPGRRFFSPTAAALAELRRDLLWADANRGRVALGLRQVLWNPPGAAPGLPDEMRAPLAEAIATLEEGAPDAATRDALAASLWDAAVRLEDGGLDDALARMQAAQEKLSEAIRNGASPDEIARLMAELKDATDAYTQMLAEAPADPAERFDRAPRAPRTISGDQIQEMMDRIQSLMNAGKMAEAQELLGQFNRMMQSLKVTQTEGGGGGSRPSQKLQDTLKRQKDLADRAMRQAQNPFGPEGAPGDGGGPGSDRPQGQPGDGAGSATEGAEEAPAGSLADQQQALRDDLRRQRALLPGAGSAAGDAAGDALDQAGRAMDEAARALREGDPAGAMTGQADAIEAMRRGLRALDQAQRAQAEGKGGGAGGSADSAGAADDGDAGARANGATDPLGRSSGNGGNFASGDGLAEGTDPAARARELQDEIRRRSGQAARPRDERDYLGRLLERF